MMNYKTKVAEIFRDRLKEALSKSKITAAELCRRSDTKQATFTQLINADEPRLPRSDTIAALAASLNVSTDWLLGLSHHPESGAEIVGRYVEVGKSRVSGDTVNHWLSFFEQAKDKKVRHIPDWLPFYFYTKDLLLYEFDYRGFTSEMADKVISMRETHLMQSRSFDLEVASIMQELEMFAKGEYYWKDLDKKVRREQLEKLVEFASMRPRIRWYLFDGCGRYAPPFTVFGSEKAAYTMGSCHFVFNTDEHIKILIDTFDEFVRDAAVESHETQGYIEDLLKYT